MSPQRLIEAGGLAALREQWQASRLLRLGVMAVLTLLCIEGLFSLSDVSKQWQAQAAQLAERNTALRMDLRQQDWLQRRDDARQQLVALRNMLWNESDPALAQARLQDWLRATSNKTQLILRELNVVREATDAAAVGPAGAPASGAQLSGEDVQALRANLKADLKRLSLMLFLSELAASEDVIVVERLSLRTAQKPPTVELDLRVLSGPQEARR